MKLHKHHFSSKMCFCGDVITLEKKMTKQKVVAELKYETFSLHPVPKQNKMKIELAVFQSHIEENILAWTYLTLLTACDKHQHNSSKDTKAVTSFAATPILLVASNFVHACMHCSISFQLGQQVSQALGKDNFFLILHA